MSRYFLHLRDGSEELLDPDGVECVDMAALRAKVLLSARDCISGDVANGIVDLRFRIEAENEAGTVVYTLPFERAVAIIPDPAATLAA